MVDIVGNGATEEEKKIKKQISKYNLEKTIFIKPYDLGIRKKLKNYDIGINCSFAEAFGRMTIEYMAAGLCVIASNKGANLELIENNINGIIYDKENINSLCDKIEYLYYNRNELKILALEGCKGISFYKSEKNCDNIYNFYNQIKD